MVKFILFYMVLGEMRRYRLGENVSEMRKKWRWEEGDRQKKTGGLEKTRSITPPLPALFD